MSNTMPLTWHEQNERTFTENLKNKKQEFKERIESMQRELARDEEQLLKDQYLIAMAKKKGKTSFDRDRFMKDAVVKKYEIWLGRRWESIPPRVFTAVKLGESVGRTFKEALDLFFITLKLGTWPQLYSGRTCTYMGRKLCDNKAAACAS